MRRPAFFQPSSALPFVLLALAALTLAGCTTSSLFKGPTPSADNRIPAHQTWCYKTLAEADCYDAPQATPANRLINVSPQSLHPLTAQEHRDAVAASR